MLRVESIETFYGKLKVLVGVSLELTAGQLVAVIGANGAGKSTLLRTIMGITPAEYGTIEFLGRRIEEEDPDEITRLGISMVPEGRWIFTDLTVQENLDMGAFTRSDKGGIREDFQRVYSMFPALKDRARQRAGVLSGGEQQMLAIGRGLMSRPKLLMRALPDPREGDIPHHQGDSSTRHPYPACGTEHGHLHGHRRLCLRDGDREDATFRGP